MTKWSPFELLYGVSPRLIGDPAILRAPVINPDPSSQETRLARLCEARTAATAATKSRSDVNKAKFDSQFEGEGPHKSNLVSYKEGDKVKIRNEVATKGQPSWFGPFTIFATLGKNVYQLIDHRESLFPYPVSGNRLKAVILRDDNLGEAWALPARLMDKIAAKDLSVPTKARKAAAKLSKTQANAAPKIRIVGRFATT